MKYVRKLLPHLCIVAAGMMIVFFCIDRVNTPIGFMANEFHKWLSLLLAVSCIVYSVMTISDQRRRERAQEKKRRERAAKPTGKGRRLRRAIGKTAINNMVSGESQGCLI